MTSSDEHAAEQHAVAARLVDELPRRVALDEAVGIVSCWRRCGAWQARRHLVEFDGPQRQDAEVARLAAVVETRADSRSDPDYWD
jgi:hypothetical protein